MSRGRSSSSSRGGSSSRGRSSSRSLSRSSRSIRSSGGVSFSFGYHHHDHHNHHGHGGYVSLGKTGSIILAIVFIFFGLMLAAFGATALVKRMQYGKVDATCIDNDYIDGWYYTTYTYEVDGVNYTSMSSEGWELSEIEGKTVTIYYLKSNPNQITELSPSNNKGILLLFGLIFTGAGVLVIVVKLKNKNKAADEVEESNENSSIVTDSNEKVSCSYCGTKVSNDKTSCPNCGGELIVRKDDNPESVKERLKVYKESTEPLIEFYACNGLLKTVNGDGDIDKVFSEIVKILG